MIQIFYYLASNEIKFKNLKQVSICITSSDRQKHKDIYCITSTLHNSRLKHIQSTNIASVIYIKARAMITSSCTYPSSLWKILHCPLINIKVRKNRRKVCLVFLSHIFEKMVKHFDKKLKSWKFWAKKHEAESMGTCMLNIAAQIMQQSEIELKHIVSGLNAQNIISGWSV